MYLLLLLLSMAVVQGSYCDPSLVVPRQGPLAYQMRGNRCEGLYEQPASGSVISLAAFYRYFEPFDTETSRSIVISWEALPEEVAVNIRAVDTIYDFYYRMDTQTPSTVGKFEWETELLERLNIATPDLGIFAWFELGLGADSVTRDVFLPITVYQSQPKVTNTYTVTVMPKMDLHEIYYFITAADTGHPASSPIKDYTPLMYGYYPAGRPVSFQLDELSTKPPGIYYLEIVADRGPRGVDVTPLYFYHRGPM